MPLFVASLLAFAGANGPKPDIPTPTQILGDFRIAPGLRLELAACEPQVQSPVAMAFDEAGRLWVVEMPDYPNGPPPGQQPEGRIRILTDRDGDGFYEQASTFAEGLLFANGVLPWKGGVIVTAAPHILYLKDSDGDGKADLRDVLFEGFATQNPQLRVSFPLLGPDGWVYVVNGLRGGLVRRAGRNEATPVNLSGMDFRFDPLDPDRHEAISGMGQFGQTFDDWGNRFVCDNNHHLRHIVLEARYLRRNPFLAVPSVVQDTCELEPGPLSSGVRLYPISKNWTTSNLHAGRFTAACGVFIYRGDLLGDRYRDSAFTCDPTGNLVHQEILRPHGATFRSRPASEGVEFLAHPSDWFRPVFLTSGPDGAMYVVDMCRAVIEHPEFMPEELKNRPDLLWGKDKGRIWRIVPADRATPRPIVGFDRMAVKDVVPLLEHANAWHRETAFRLLLERQDAEAIPLLVRIVEQSPSPMARALAASLVQRMAPDHPQRPWLRLLGEEHPRLRQIGVRMLGEADLAQPMVVERLAKLAEDPDPAVRFQVALALGDIRGHDELVVAALARIGRTSAEDSWARLAIASSASQHAPKLVAALLQGDQRRSGSLTYLIGELATLIGASRETAGLIESLQAFLALPDADLSLKLSGIHALATGLERRGIRLQKVLNELPEKHRTLREDFLRFGDGMLAKAEQAGTGFWTPETVRFLAYLPWEKSERPLRAVFDADGDAETRRAAVRALAAHQPADLAPYLISKWRTLTPTLRAEVVAVLLRDEASTLHLLDAIAAGKVGPSELEPTRVQQLLQDRREVVQRKARTVLQSQLPTDRREVLERYKAALQMNGDARRGQEVFRNQCAGCHQVRGIGVNVGPDISDTRTKTPEGLLVDILNPNQAIDGNYINYTVLLKDGRIVTGVIASETPTALVLKRAENQTDTVLRTDIEALRSSGQSLMPEGLEKTISMQEMADLLAFLKNWRYLDGTVPLGPSR
ncbi:MAG: HEAT repeat domain-containing protein [Gemmatales bacterium]|nr:HEAT repeat domain-containing protein [Gemmatales bacterium]MDW8386875.1 HEAT repeat domain-containing protein [Gemmatales bacterium]